MVAVFVSVASEVSRVVARERERKRERGVKSGGCQRCQEW